MNKKSNTFDKDYSSYYDLIYSDKNYTTETLLISNWIKKYSKIIDSKLLDASCGTGSHAVELAKLGYQVEGSDLSEGMLLMAREKAVKNNVQLTLKHGEMQNIHYDNKFGTIISLFDSVNYLNSLDELDKFIANSYKALRKGGLLIFQFWNGIAVINSRPEKRIKKSRPKQDN